MIRPAHCGARVSASARPLVDVFVRQMHRAARVFSTFQTGNFDFLMSSANYGNLGVKLRDASRRSHAAIRSNQLVSQTEAPSAAICRALETPAFEYLGRDEYSLSL